MRRRELMQDPSGSITVYRASGLVFDSGADWPLLMAYKRIGYPSGQLPGRCMLNVDLLLRAGALPKCHVLDVTADDPLNFRFTYYGTDAKLGGRFRHRRIADHGIPLLQDYACGEYSRIKATGQPDLSQVEILAGWSNSVTAYRRLVLPFGEGREVTHFLILFTTDVQQISPGAVDQEGPAVRERVHDRLAAASS